MANQITALGIETDTLQELLDSLTAQMEAIYGADINVDSDTPDGQLLNIFVQAALDLEDLIVQVYNSFDPDLAVGIALDQRCAINGVQRRGGTFTVTPINVTVDRALNLVGLDAQVDNPDGEGYTVSDDAGTEWILMASQTIASPGVYTYNFRAKNPGEVLTVPNTITIPVTIVLGVTIVNNPDPASSIGQNAETDAALRIRRQKSVALSSQGYLDGLLAALLNITGVTAAFVYENDDDVIDGDLIPGHSIWVIVEGGDADSIGEAIYAKRNAGCGMKGDEEVIIDQVDGSQFIVKYDEVVTETLYIQFDATSINGTDEIDTDALKAAIIANLPTDVYEEININQLATIVQDEDPNCLVTGAGFSLSGAGPFTNTLQPSAKNKRFTIDTANIDITVL